MDNSSIEEAKSYHQITKRTPEDGPKVTEPSRHAKTYLDVAVSPLADNVQLSGMSTLDALANTEFDEDIEVDMAHLSGILEAATSYIRQSRQQHGACCTEIYVVATEMAGLPAGVYHVDSQTFTLKRLREGDHRPDLVATAGDNQSLAAAPVTVILSAVLTDSYRTILSETGRILARVLAAASGAHIAASVEMSFVDAQVNGLLGLDGQSEAALCLIPLGRSLDWAEHVGERVLPAVGVKTERPVLVGSSDPDLAKIHRASSLLSNEETRPLRGPCTRLFSEILDATRIDRPTRESRPLGEVLGEEPNPGCAANTMDIHGLSALLHQATVDLPADFLEGSETSLLDPYLVVQRVDGLEPGLYEFRPHTRGLARIQSGDLSPALEQSLVSSPVDPPAAVHLILASDLAPVLERFGNRGYRLAQVEAGIVAGRLALAAQSMGLGAPVLEFFDDAMSRLLSPYADGKEVMLTLGLG